MLTTVIYERNQAGTGKTSPLRTHTGISKGRRRSQDSRRSRELLSAGRPLAAPVSEFFTPNRKRGERWFMNPTCPDIQLFVLMSIISSKETLWHANCSHMSNTGCTEYIDCGARGLDGAFGGTSVLPVNGNRRASLWCSDLSGICRGSDTPELFPGSGPARAPGPGSGPPGSTARCTPLFDECQRRVGSIQT